MSLQGNDPAQPQAEVTTVAGENQTARVGPYVDTSLTKRRVVETAAESDLPPPSGATTLGGTRPVYATDQEEQIDSDAAATENAAVDPPPHAPNKWARGTVNGRRRSRDPYANEGMIGQDVFKNQG